MPSIPAQLHLLRKSKGWTQAQLAERIGTDTSTITHIERGTRSPGMAVLSAWAEACDAKVILIPQAGGDGHSADEITARLLLLTTEDRAELLRLVDLWPTLEARSRRILLAAIGG